jgi:putative FmdB family regulatory protein
MPTYDYECDACGHKFDEFQSINADPLTKCPECKKKKLRRLFGTGAAIVFKGSGFYQTDYRSDSYKKAAAKDAPASDSKSESGSSSSKSESSSGETKSDSSSSSSSQPSESKSPKKNSKKPKSD